MLEWDRIVFMLLAVSLAVYQGYVGWQEWRKARYDAVAGSVVLVIVTIAMPLILALSGLGGE